MAKVDDEQFCFIVEWYDPNAAITRQYNFVYWPADSSVEMYDIKNHRQFLRRAKVDNIRLCDLFMGNSINVLARQLTIVAYGDQYTQRRVGSKKERTLGMIKPDAMPKMGYILDAIWQNGLQITKLKSFNLNRGEASELYYDHKDKEYYSDLTKHISSGAVLAFEMRGENAVQRWLDLLGPCDPSRARDCAPTTIRARYGTDCVRNAGHGAPNAIEAEREIEFFFSETAPPRQNSACYLDCTCGIVKPHAILDGTGGDVITKILECGFEITALAMHVMEKANAEEFLEVYRGVVQEYPVMVTELISGPCIAMEIRAQDAVCKFRELAGPADPEIARHLRPRTLRALFGRSKTMNAVHCTDLPEDGLLEVEYFFKVLDR